MGSHHRYRKSNEKYEYPTSSHYNEYMQYESSRGNMANTTQSPLFDHQQPNLSKNRKEELKLLNELDISLRNRLQEELPMGSHHRYRKSNEKYEYPTSSHYNKYMQYESSRGNMANTTQSPLFDHQQPNLSKNRKEELKLLNELDISLRNRLQEELPMGSHHRYRKSNEKYEYPTSSHYNKYMQYESSRGNMANTTQSPLFDHQQPNLSNPLSQNRKEELKLQNSGAVFCCGPLHSEVKSIKVNFAFHLSGVDKNKATVKKISNNGMIKFCVELNKSATKYLILEHRLLEMPLNQENILQRLKNNGPVPGAWALVTYMEGNKPINECYITEKYYEIDNSAFGGDEFRFGLGSIQELRASQAEILYKGHLHIVLSQEDGSIFLRNNSHFPVFVKDFLEAGQPYFSQQVIEHQGIITSQEDLVKIFDVEEFRSEMALQMYHNQYNIEQLMLLCKTNVLFADAQHCMQSSSWIIVTNLLALDLVFDKKEHSEIEVQIASYVAAGTLKQMKKKLLKQNMNSAHKIFETRRRSRMSLIIKGLKVYDFMPYSWENEDVAIPEDTLDIKELEQYFEPENDYMTELQTETPQNTSKLVGEKMWAKVKYTLENMKSENT